MKSLCFMVSVARPRHLQSLVAECPLTTTLTRPPSLLRSWCHLSALTAVCLLARVWSHGGWDNHLCECICVHRELPAREPTHSHRPPHTPELLTAPTAPVLPTRISYVHLAESTDLQPPFLSCRQPIRLRGPAQQAG